MKVRRILALVLSAALAVTALTACTSAKDEASQKSADKQTTTLSYDTVKIGVIHIGTLPTDQATHMLTIRVSLVCRRSLDLKTIRS